MSGDRDPIRYVRRAGAVDRRRDPYEQRRAAQARERAVQDRDADPGPPNDDDWTAPDAEHEDGLRAVAPPAPVGEVLSGLVRSRGWRDRLRGVSVFDRWDDIVGPELARRCVPVRVAGGVLTIRAVDQTWATQLTYMERDLIRRAAEVLGRGVVVRVRITVGAGPRGDDGPEGGGPSAPDRSPDRS